MKYRYLNRLWIRARVRKWIAPALCAIPYVGSIIWLLLYSKVWIAMTMIVPAFLILSIGLLTWVLARIEFYGYLKR